MVGTISSEGDDAPVSALLLDGRPEKQDVHLEREVLLARLFPTRVARPKLGRYDVLELVGEGGMGTVYAAYDPQLDRRVAVKLLRQTSGGEEQRRARLLREAMALARLSHPNIVAIHEVWEEHGEIHLAMEFVRGQSLAQWQHSPRPWRELLEVYRQAGEGLAAAHDAGLVHRDFKPHNVIRRDDGVVKLLDFGLARLGGLSEPSQPQVTLGDDEPGPTSATHLTRPGAIMGTPSYMAPEQHEGRLADACSDQFSFCVSLWEGLYGELPFSREPGLGGGQPGALRRVEPSRERVVPGWVRRVLERGLAPDPADRHPSMRALLRELGRDPAVQRRRALGVAAGAVLAVGGGLVVAELRADPPTSCVQVRTPWGPEPREAVREGVMGSGGAGAPQTWELLSPRLDRYADQLLQRREGACESHRRGLVPEVHYAQQAACLDRAEAGFEALVGLLQRGDEQAISNANMAIGQLPSPPRCMDAEALLTEVRPPEDPDVAVRVDELREELARASAEEAAGLHAQAEDRAAAVLGQARPLGHAPLVAEALLRWGSAGMQAGRDDAPARLDQALWLSVSNEQRQVAAEAAAKRIYARVELQDRAADVTEAIELARSLVTRAGAADWRTRWLLSNNVGVALERRGERSEALAAYEAALAELPEQGDEGSFERAVTWLNMAPVQVRLGQTAQAERSAHAAVTELTALYGSEHPQLRVAEGSLAMVLRTIGRHAEAEATMSAVLEHFSEQDPPPLWMLLEATRIAWQQGDVDAVRAWCRQVEPRLVRSSGVPSLWEVSFALMKARAAAAAGDPSVLEALDALARALAPERSLALALGRAEILLTLHRPQEAEAVVAPLVADVALTESSRIAASLLLGRSLVAQARWDEAQRHLSAVLGDGGGRLEPLEHAHALQALSLAEAGLGQPTQALAYAEQALAVLGSFDPTSPARREAEAVWAKVRDSAGASASEPTTGAD